MHQKNCSNFNFVYIYFVLLFRVFKNFIIKNLKLLKRIIYYILTKFTKF